MRINRTLVWALGVVVSCSAIAPGFAQVGDYLKSATAPAVQPGGANASALQDQLVKAYTGAASESMLGQAKMAEALGLKDQAAAATASAQALTSGATVSSSTLKDAKKVETDTQAAVDKALAQSSTLSDESKTAFGAGLGHMGAGLLGTIKLKDSATTFSQSAHAEISSASLMTKMSVTNKLSSGMYVAENLPGHIGNLASGLKSAVSFAQNHNIPIPADATAALENMH